MLAMPSVLRRLPVLACLALEAGSWDEAALCESDSLHLLQVSASLRLNDTARQPAVAFLYGHDVLPAYGFRASERRSLVMGVSSKTMGTIRFSFRVGSGFRSVLFATSPLPDVLLQLSGRVTASTVLVLLMCSDNLVWLLPFLTGHNKHRMAMWYVSCMGSLWAIAFLVFVAVRVLGRSHPDMPFQAISQVTSTLLLFVLACKLFHEWFCEGHEQDVKTVESEVAQPELPESNASPAAQAEAPRSRADSVEEGAKCTPDGLANAQTEAQQPPVVGHAAVIEEGSNSRASSTASCFVFIPKVKLFARSRPTRNQRSSSPTRSSSPMRRQRTDSSPKRVRFRSPLPETHECAPPLKMHTDEPVQDLEGELRNKQLTYAGLVMVSLAGNIEKIGVYVPILLAGVLSPLELLLGNLVAAVIIACTTLQLGQFQYIIGLLTRVPMWVILGTIAMCVGANAVVTLNEPRLRQA